LMAHPVTKFILITHSSKEGGGVPSEWDNPTGCRFEARAGAVHTKLAARIPEQSNHDLYTEAWITQDPVGRKYDELRKLCPEKAAQFEADMMSTAPRGAQPLVSGGPPRAGVNAAHAYPERGYPRSVPSTPSYHRGDWTRTKILRYPTAVEMASRTPGHPYIFEAECGLPAPPAPAEHRSAVPIVSHSHTTTLHRQPIW